MWGTLAVYWCCELFRRLCWDSMLASIVLVLRNVRRGCWDSMLANIVLRRLGFAGLRFDTARFAGGYWVEPVSIGASIIELHHGAIWAQDKN